MQGLWSFTRRVKPDSVRVLIFHPVIEFLQAASASCLGKPEIGGIFIGDYRGPHLEVMSFTKPGPADESQLYSFHRRDPLHQATAMVAWTDSDGVKNCVGEWHTHPFGRPSPSSTDLKTWKEITDRRKMPMVCAIAAPAGWRPYLMSPKSGVAHPLEKVEDGNDGDVYAYVG